MAFSRTWPFELLLVTLFAWLLFLGVHSNIQEEFEVNVITGSLKWFVFSYTLANTTTFLPLAILLGLGWVARLIFKDRPSWKGLFRGSVTFAVIVVVVANFDAWYGKCRESYGVDHCSPLRFPYAIVVGEG